MKAGKWCAFLLPGVLLLLASGSEARAGHLRLSIGPWWPVPIIVAPVPPGPFVFPPPPPVTGPPVGFVDTNVRPKDAQVVVDGQYRGIADTFDGVPAYLELSPGRHTIEFSREGHEPVTVIVFVEPGQVVSVELAMRERAGEAPPAERRTYQLETEGTGFLLLDVEPADAAVYIDNAFYGPASQFREAEHKILLRSGRHTVEIGRPGYVLFRGSVTIVAEETTPLKVNLER